MLAVRIDKKNTRSFEAKTFTDRPNDELQQFIEFKPCRIPSMTFWYMRTSWLNNFCRLRLFLSLSADSVGKDDPRTVFRRNSRRLWLLSPRVQNLVENELRDGNPR
jgi:hypothetical protein